MRLLLANANTDEAVTAALTRAARAAASPGTHIVPATAASGVPVIRTQVDLTVAQGALLNTVARHVQGCVGIVVGVSLDLAVDTLAQRHGLPVVGMTGAALEVAARMADRVGVITLGPAMTTMFRARFAAAHTVLLECVDIDPAQAAAQQASPTELLGLLAAAAGRLVARGAQVVLPIGATVAGLAPQVRASVPVLDCIGCAVQELERQVQARAGAGA
jgi:allantoin racemase